MTKLIFACDVSDMSLGDALIEKVKSHIDLVKIGLEAMTAEAKYGGTIAQGLYTRAAEMCGLGVMWDMKLHDVANTMRMASRNIVKMGATYFTIHATASDEALAATAEEAQGRALAVTVLTDLDEPQCQSRFGINPGAAVEAFAKNARHFGIHGFVCSPHEAAIIRSAIPDAFIVTPGIRPEWSVSKDEQKRITTPAMAKKLGADAIVVGRPISKPPLEYVESYAARLIKEELDAA